MNNFLVGLLVVAGYSSVTFAAGHSLASDPEVAANLRLLETSIEAQREYHELPGLSVGIVYDQDLIWARGFGLADMETETASTPRTLYRMASNSKLFTATAIVQLRDAGKLQLDDPVEKHLAWFSIEERDPEAPAITIRHLLTHTSGVFSYTSIPGYMDQKVRRDLTTEELIDVFKALPMDFGIEIVLMRSAGAAFVAWTSIDTDAATAFNGVAKLDAVWWWDGEAWQLFAPRAPAPLSTN